MAGVCRPLGPRRLGAARRAELDAVCGEVSRLTPGEAAAADAARATLDGRWKPEAAARARLAKEPGLRRPEWLASLEASPVLAGKPRSHVDKFMIVLERMTSGVGLGLPGWPDEVRLCDAAMGPLTLGADVQLVKYHGKQLERCFGVDQSNGWAYTHALGKLRAYQAMLLGDDAFDAPSLSDLDGAALAVATASLPSVVVAAPVTPDTAVLGA